MVHWLHSEQGWRTDWAKNGQIFISSLINLLICFTLSLHTFLCQDKERYRHKQVRKSRKVYFSWQGWATQPWNASWYCLDSVTWSIAKIIWKTERSLLNLGHLSTPVYSRICSEDTEVLMQPRAMKCHGCGISFAVKTWITGTHWALWLWLQGGLQFLKLCAFENM